MAFWRRDPGPPEPLASQLAAGERILGWGRGPDQRDGSPTLVAATTDALYAPGYLDRLPWQRVIRAGWDDPVLEVSYTPERATPGVAPRILRVTLTEPGAVPEAVRDRVTGSVVVQQHLALRGTKGATVIARRGDGAQMRWQVIFDAGLDANDPQLRADADAALAALRATLGI